MCTCTFIFATCHLLVNQQAKELRDVGSLAVSQTPVKNYVQAAAVPHQQLPVSNSLSGVHNPQPSPIRAERQERSLKIIAEVEN